LLSKHTHLRLMPVIVSLVASAVTSSPVASHATVPLGAGELLSGTVGLIPSTPIAIAAREFTFNETAHLHLVSHYRGLLREEGSATGTYNCPIAISLHTSYTTATIWFSMCRSGGYFSGSGSASFYATGSLVHFKGSVSITHGTGRYAHASAAGLGIRGTFQRRNYALSVRVSGRMRV